MENQKNTRNTLEALLIFIMSLALFTVGLGNQEFINFDTRFAMFAQEMLKNGVSFFPTAFGEPYPDYPATSTILIYLCSLPWGYVTKFSAVLPSAMATSLTLSFMYLTVAPFSKRWGICSVFFAFFTVGFISASRSIALDQYITLVTMASFYLAYSAHVHHKNTPWWCFPLLFLFSFACRGPIGIVIPASVVASMYVLQKDWHKFFTISIISLITLTISLLLLLGAAYLQGGLSFMYDVLHMQILSRLSNDAQDPFYYYLLSSFGTYAISYPLALILCVGLFPKLRHLELNHPLKLLQLLAVWTLVIIIGMSIPHEKKPRYILAIVPAISLISGYLFVEKFPLPWMKILRKIVAWMCFSFPLVGAVLTQVAENELERRGLHLRIDFTTIIITLCVLQALAVILCLTYRTSRSREIIALGIATLVFVAINIVMVEPIILSLTQSRHFVSQVDKVRAKHPGVLVFYRADKEALVMRYVVNSHEYVQPIVDVTTPEALQQLPGPLYVIMQLEEFAKLPPAVAAQFHVIMEGRVGRDVAVALAK